MALIVGANMALTETIENQNDEIHASSSTHRGAEPSGWERAPDDFTYVPPPPGRPAAQTNDVFVDGRGFVYAIDRYVGLSVLELRRND